jgi:hypothetical protein
MDDTTNVFDNLDALRKETEQLDMPKSTGKRARSQETFARIYHDRALQLYGRIGAAAWVVLIELDRLILESSGHQNPIPFNHDRLFAVGMTRSAIYKALRQLQKAKVIQVKHWGRHAKDVTLVTHLWYPPAK